MTDNITVIIKTFIRPKALAACVESVRELLGDVLIYVADDSPEETIVPLKNVDEYFILPPDSGLSFGRNYLVDKVQTEYLMLMDDDTLFYPETAVGVQESLALLENPSIDLVGGKQFMGSSAWPYYGAMEMREGRRDDGTFAKNLILHNHRSDYSVDDIPMYDYVSNMFVAKTASMKEARRDDDLKVFEHLEFFWRNRTALRCTYLESLVFNNVPGSDDEYSKHRCRTEYEVIQKEKLGIANIEPYSNGRPTTWKKIMRICKRAG